MTLIDGRNDTVAVNRYVVLGNESGTATSTTRKTSARPAADVGDSKRRNMESVTGMLDRIGCGYLLLNREKKVVEWNAAAQGIFERQDEAAGTAAEL